MTDQQSRSQKVGVTLSADLVKKLRILAALENSNISQIVTESLEKHLATKQITWPELSSNQAPDSNDEGKLKKKLSTLLV